MKVVVLLSGGIDSAVMAYNLIVEHHEIVGALSVFYGQKHSKELEAAQKIARCLNIPRHEVIDLRNLQTLLAASSLTSSEKIPEGHYQEASMKSTVVPNRNSILLNIAAGWAITLKADAIAYAAHSGDHEIYPDCRPVFVKRLEKLLKVADYKPVKILAPFLNYSKTDIVRLGNTLGVPFDLTWSCYNGQEEACGKCGTCVERLEAFKENGLTDPIKYREGK